MKPVKIKVAKKIYSLKYTINSICELEENTKYASVNDLMEDVQKGSFSAIRAFVWAGLVWENSELTLSEVGDYLTGKDALNKFVQAAGEAFVNSMPGAEESDEGEGSPKT